VTIAHLASTKLSHRASTKCVMPLVSQRRAVDYPELHRLCETGGVEQALKKKHLL